ncbi:hypothetical protein KUTeg_023475 [Tegillarca granosa]|uniref:carbonic anhydrase n=1 Tax=Tegillarca granosa TaxID=220873 RepID=A0ABQ9E7B7_TEGGR|nr:hypothetical protein KUTeg_023475 [Tegillarca granosa]
MTNTIYCIHIFTGKTTSLTSYDLFRLLPTEFTENSPYYRYFGSLTTPPCDESVIWTVFRKTIKISNSQLAKFRTLISEDRSTLQDNS